MDLDDIGLLSIFLVFPYAIALQILLITFVRKYINARRELSNIKQEQYNEKALAASRAYHPAPHVPAAPAPVATPAPAASPAPAVQPAPVPAATPATTAAPTPKKRSRISSTSITFGVGVLLLTIVGAAFLSVSWSFMRNATRALTLVAAVAVVYFLAFLSGKVLKLKQTGFAFYTLGSFLGPIVVVGVGMFRLLGKWFSFSNGNGWIVAAVASLVMAVSAIIGKYIYKSKFYTGITYFSFTWLIVFVSGQIGDESLYIYPYECIFIAIALLAVILRIIMIFKADDAKLSFRIYSELITYASVLLMTITVFMFIDDGGDGYFTLAGTVLANAALILHARFTPKRNWVKYLAPFAALATFFTIFISDFRYPESGWIVTGFFAVIYAVFFLTKLRTLLSDILFTSVMVFSLLIADLFSGINLPLIVAAGVAAVMCVLSSLFTKTKTSGGVNAGFAGLWFYIMTVVLMGKIIGDEDITLYFVIFMPLALAAVLVLTVIRRFVNDDYRIRIASEVINWSSLLFGLFSRPSIKELTWQVEHTNLSLSDVTIKIWTSGILLLAASLLLAYNYYLNAKKKESFSVSSFFVISLALNAPAFVAFIPGMLLEISKIENRAYMIAYSVMFAVMAGALVLIRFAPLFKKEKLLLYAKYMIHMISGMLCVWIVLSFMDWDATWNIIAMPVILLALYFFGNEFYAILPLTVFEFAVCQFFTDVVRIPDKNMYNLLFFALTVGQFALGRLFYRKRIFSAKGIDYLAIIPAILLFGFKDRDYVVSLVFLALSLMIFNFIGRTKISAKKVAFLASLPLAAAIIAQQFIDIDDIYMTEFVLGVILADAAVFRFLIKPADEKVMKYSWFVTVASCLTIEGISAAVSGETFDLIVTGVAAGGIFLFSFIKKSRLWFILGVVSIIGIAVYLSATFWSSMAWLLYLLIAGVIMIAIAAGNEWRKRHSSDAKKLFEEWKW